MPAYTPQQQALDAELLMLLEITRAVESGRGLSSHYERGFMHYLDVFEDAVNPADNTGRRERFAKWFGKDAERFTRAFLAFLQSYVRKCQDAGERLPFFRFESEEERTEIVLILQKIREAMDAFHEGFAIWPPPRTHRCF